MTIEIHRNSEHLELACKSYVLATHMGSAVITPHVSDVMGVIVLTSCVCLSVCVCVCYHSHSRTDRRTDLNFGMEVKWKDI